MKTARAFRLMLPAAAAALLAACTNTQPPAPVTDGTMSGGSTATVGSNDGSVYTPPGGDTVQNNTQNPYETTPYTPSGSGSTGQSDNGSVYTPPARSGGTFVPNYAPVDVNASTHRVVAGDTIYNISKRYGISQNNLREWNNLAGDNINVGQVLRVKPHGAAGSYSGGSSAGGSVSGSGTHRVAAGDTVYNISKRYGISQNDLREWNNLAGDNIQIGQVLRVDSGGGSSASARPQPQPQPQPESHVSVTPSANTGKYGGITWQSPVPGGRVIKAFSTEARGIEVGSSRGQSVLAAADGTVIYGTKGPRDFEQLVIIQHSPQYLSAYGYNEKLLVKEGQRVKRGQKIAVTGSKGKLHLEIREKSKVNNNDKAIPIDPTRFIPF